MKRYLLVFLLFSSPAFADPASYVACRDGLVQIQKRLDAFNETQTPACIQRQNQGLAWKTASLGSRNRLNGLDSIDIYCTHLSTELYPIVNDSSALCKGACSAMGMNSLKNFCSDSLDRIGQGPEKLDAILHALPPGEPSYPSCYTQMNQVKKRYEDFLAGQSDKCKALLDKALPKDVLTLFSFSQSLNHLCKNPDEVIYASNDKIKACVTCRHTSSAEMTAACDFAGLSAFIGRVNALPVQAPAPIRTDDGVPPAGLGGAPISAPGQ